MFPMAADHTIYSKGGVLVPSEHHIRAFHDWIEEKVGDTIHSS